ncbi:MAG: Gfo/Idh/MocA family oxidoreductase [Verrucomicrobiae bacterium]|nr:Gfo/Idh/MocA family oxidoreductase [Verrucomicrobiae bacterium]
MENEKYQVDMTKVAIIGTGAISDSHINAYLKFGERCRIVAVVDLFAEKARQKAEAYKLKANVYSSVDELIEKEDFEAASICLPPFEHASSSIKLLGRGKHVLVEKPMATSVEECDRMIEAAEKNNCLLGIVSQNRFRTPVMRLKRLIDEKVAGKVLLGQVESLWWRGANYYDLWWRGTWDKEGGGCTINHAVHHIDMFLWMMGMPGAVSAITANLNHTNSEVEDFSSAILFYPGNIIGQITASLIHHGEEQKLLFQCEDASLAMPWRVCAYRQRENGFPEENHEMIDKIQGFYNSLPEVKNQGHDGQIENFLNAIDGKEQLLVDGVQGRNTVMLISAIYLSAHLGTTVELPLAKDSVFYSREGIIENARRFHKKTKSVENFSDTKITFGRQF